MDIEKLFAETIPKFSEEYSLYMFSLMPLEFSDFYNTIAKEILEYSLGFHEKEYGQYLNDSAHIKEYKKFLEKFGDCHSREYYTICFHNWFELKYGYEVSRIQY
jgi:hypothetical protein